MGEGGGGGTRRLLSEVVSETISTIFWLRHYYATNTYYSGPGMPGMAFRARAHSFENPPSKAIDRKGAVLLRRLKRSVHTYPEAGKGAFRK